MLKNTAGNPDADKESNDQDEMVWKLMTFVAAAYLQKKSGTAVSSGVNTRPSATAANFGSRDWLHKFASWNAISSVVSDQTIVYVYVDVFGIFPHWDAIDLQGRRAGWVLRYWLMACNKTCSDELNGPYNITTG